VQSSKKLQEQEEQIAESREQSSESKMIIHHVDTHVITKLTLATQHDHDTRVAVNSTGQSSLRKRSLVCQENGIDRQKLAHIAETRICCRFQPCLRCFSAMNKRFAIILSCTSSERGIGFRVAYLTKSRKMEAQYLSSYRRLECVPYGIEGKISDLG
jgi:hypothetical protein